MKFPGIACQRRVGFDGGGKQQESPRQYTNHIAGLLFGLWFNDRDNESEKELEANAKVERAGAERKFCSGSFPFVYSALAAFAALAAALLAAVTRVSRSRIRAALPRNARR